MAFAQGIRVPDRPLWPRPSRARRAWIEAGLVTLGLAGIALARWAWTRAGFDALLVGAGFGFALLGLVAVARPNKTAPPWRSRTPSAIATAGLSGVAVGLALILVASVGPAIAGEPRVVGLARPAAPFVPWGLVTMLVAAAEEVILRGVMFGAIRRAGGTVAALALTTAAFALIHVPLYGWHVVPLDLAVGFAFGGLRIATRGIAAPAIAHAVADLATWWL
jgi:membrane protease YdiL (CAAX protease family)